MVAESLENPLVAQSLSLLVPVWLGPLLGAWLLVIQSASRSMAAAKLEVLLFVESPMGAYRLAPRWSPAAVVAWDAH